MIDYSCVQIIIDKYREGMSTSDLADSMCESEDDVKAALLSSGVRLRVLDN